MADSIRDLLVISDMDGTLLNAQHRIAASDLETIRLFRALGGHFTVATGRTYESISMYPELAAIVEPAITCGGAVIYDFKKEDAVKSFVLPAAAAHLAMREALDRFPALGAMVMGDDMRLYRVETSEALQGLIDIEQMTYFTRPEEDLPEFWNKVLFAGPSEVLGDMAAFTAERNYPGMYFVKTNACYYEMMPEGVDKGTAVLVLCEMLGVKQENTVVIGDYFNDITMMRSAGHAVAMQNAPPEVRAVANELTGSNEESGVGQYLYKLIKQFG